MAIGRELYWVKWFKNGVGQGFIFHEIFLNTILFGENFISKVKNPYTSECVDFNYGTMEKVNKNVRGTKMVDFIKTFNQKF